MTTQIETRERPVDLWCYEITHDGEGERGDKVLVMSRHGHRSPEFYAQEAAEYFHDQEKRRERLTDSDLHGTSTVIEVEGYPGKPEIRFRVYCVVGRTYSSVALDAVPCPAPPPRRPRMIDATGAVGADQAASAEMSP